MYVSPRTTLISAGYDCKMIVSKLARIELEMGVESQNSLNGFVLASRVTGDLNESKIEANSKFSGLGMFCWIHN